MLRPRAQFARQFYYGKGFIWTYNNTSFRNIDIQTVHVRLNMNKEI